MLIHKLVPLFICISVIANILSAQDSIEVVILNPKVGEVIDSTEREYYGLFRVVKNFSSATIVQLPNGKFEARTITSSGQEMTSMEMPEAMVYLLAERIEYYEELKEGAYVMGAHRPAIRIGSKIIGEDYNERHNKDVNRAVIETRRSVQYTGKILFVNDSLLVVWKSTEPYNSQKLSLFAIPLSFFEIERVVIKQESNSGSGMLTGFLVGACSGVILGIAIGDSEGNLITPSYTAAGNAFGLGLVFGILGAVGNGISSSLQSAIDDFIIKGDIEKYKVVIPTLKKNAIFPSALPPELQEFLTHK
jgi:hypothetical protein